jgi:hypothetical protein
MLPALKLHLPALARKSLTPRPHQRPSLLFTLYRKSSFSHFLPSYTAMVRCQLPHSCAPLPRSPASACGFVGPDEVTTSTERVQGLFSGGMGQQSSLWSARSCGQALHICSQSRIFASETRELDGRPGSGRVCGPGVCPLLLYGSGPSGSYISTVTRMLCRGCLLTLISVPRDLSVPFRLRLVDYWDFGFPSSYKAQLGSKQLMPANSALAPSRGVAPSQRARRKQEPHTRISKFTFFFNVTQYPFLSSVLLFIFLLNGLGKGVQMISPFPRPIVTPPRWPDQDE